MHYEHLIDITSHFHSDGAYEKAMAALEWHPSPDMAKNIDTIEEFLRAWGSLRGGPLDIQEMVDIWTREIEPYARALEQESLEDLQVERVVRTSTESVRVGVAIEHIYSALDSAPGVGQTNACKILHLRLPNLIVMTDVDVRTMFRQFRHETFSPYSYAFNFLPFVRRDLDEALDTLCQAKSLDRRAAVLFLQNIHGSTRSLAKLMDECYYRYAHEHDKFPVDYCASLFRWTQPP